MINPVRKTTLKVVKEAKKVKINRGRIENLAKIWIKKKIIIPAWPKKLHLQTKNKKSLLDYLILLNSLNFCFWSKKEKWGIYYKGKFYDGYFALSLALKNFFEKNPKKANFDYLAKISFSEFASILKGKGKLLLFKERHRIVKAVSQALLEKYQGDSVKFVLSANHLAEILVSKIVKELPFFNDYIYYKNFKVYFLKRAQILVSDIWGVFDGRGIGYFNDLDYLTVFSDYKLPQILNHFSVLEYSKDLEEKISKKINIPPGSEEETEIRSAAIWAVEYLKKDLEKLGRKFYSFQIDWILWSKSQKIKMKVPHHLTKTIFY